MTDDDISLALTIIFGTLLLLFSPFLAYHVYEHWYDPEPIHSGFTPECPEWTEPVSLSPNK